MNLIDKKTMKIKMFQFKKIIKVYNKSDQTIIQTLLKEFFHPKIPDVRISIRTQQSKSLTIMINTEKKFMPRSSDYHALRDTSNYNYCNKAATFSDRSNLNYIE